MKGRRRAARVAVLLCLLIGTVATLPALQSGCRARQGATAGKVNLVLWHVWGGEQAKAIDNIIKRFEAAHPDITVQPVFTRNDLATSQKFFTAVAAEAPPDVVFVDGPQVAPWAEWGALEALDSRLEATGIKPDDYFVPCWGQCAYRGHTWALTYCADPNFGFVWNKDRFREAGLDPNKPPATVEELDKLAEALTDRAEDGELRTIGFVPWAQYGSANSMFTWGWAFGGDFFNYDTSRLTADDPKVVRALAWMISYCDKFDVRKISALEAGFGTQEQDPFYTGKMAMRCLHIGGIVDIGKYAPDLDWGVTFIPAPSVGGEEHSSWVGGWCVAIPRGSPHPDEAFELMRWMCHDPAGTTAVWEEAGLFPGVRNAPCFEGLKDKPYYRAFLDIVEACKHQRPVMPSQAFFMREMDRAVDAARFGRIGPPKSVALVWPSGSEPSWSAELTQGLEQLGAAVTDDPASADMTVVDMTGDQGPVPPGLGDCVLAVTDAPDPPHGAQGYVAPPLKADDVRRWWVAKRALAQASENTQRELDLILKGSR